MCILTIIIDESVINSMEISCFLNCGSIFPKLVNLNDQSLNDFNECCNTISRTSGYGTTQATCTTACKFCYNHYIPIHIIAIYL